MKRGKTKWDSNLGRIKGVVEASNAPFLDRAAIEKAFRIGPRSAHKLMAKIGREDVGGTRLVARDSVLRFLHARARSLPYLADVVRRRRVAEVLQEAKIDAGVRAVRIKLAPVARAMEDLPSTIRLGPGELHIACASMEDLMAQLFQVSQAMTRDFERLKGIVEGRRQV